MNNLVERAKDLAYRAHAGQVDKAGRPYIEHVARVAAAVSDEPETEAVAWLHDIYEDCDAEFCRELERGFSIWIVAACMRLARGVYTDYYDAIKEQRSALRVKLADIADNADESRLALLDDKTADRLRRKYRKALEALS